MIKINKINKSGRKNIFFFVFLSFNNFLSTDENIFNIIDKNEFQSSNYIQCREVIYI